MSRFNCLSYDDYIRDLGKCCAKHDDELDDERSVETSKYKAGICRRLIQMSVVACVIETFSTRVGSSTQLKHENKGKRAWVLDCSAETDSMIVLRGRGFVNAGG